MNFNSNPKIAVCRLLLILILVLCIGCSMRKDGEEAISVGRLPNIEPDYCGIVIPPNIAPLNFFIKETGTEFIVRIHSMHGDPIRLQTSSGRIQIPPGQWKDMLSENLGEKLIMEISVKNETDRWIRFDSVVNRISKEPMDSYLAYRRFKPIFNMWQKMGVYQRCLETFDEKPVLLNRLTKVGCMNCHNFWQNGTDRWLLHLRGGSGTCMLLDIDGKVRKINTKTKFNGPAAYPAWHPSGDLIAFSVSNLILFFHETGECRDVLDRSSEIILYDIQANTITTTPQISSPDRLEIWPAWSPDGRFLYFCSAPKIETPGDLSRSGKSKYDKIKYDLMRIAYDPERRVWGSLETVISSKDLGLSITEPRVSPDGRFVLFTAAKYSQFPIYISSADLYLLDLQTGRWKKMEINSDRADSFHSWSSNGRWIVFSSKREDGLFTKPYFSHIDTLGNASKPFVLPQEDPLFYKIFLEVFNVPEFTKEPVRVSPQVLAEAAFSEKDALSAILDSNVISNRNNDKAGSSEEVQIQSSGKKINR